MENTINKKIKSIEARIQKEKLKIKILNNQKKSVSRKQKHHAQFIIGGLILSNKDKYSDTIRMVMFDADAKDKEYLEKYLDESLKNT